MSTEPLSKRLIVPFQLVTSAIFAWHRSFGLPPHVSGAGLGRIIHAVRAFKDGGAIQWEDLRHPGPQSTRAKALSRWFPASVHP